MGTDDDRKTSRCSRECVKTCEIAGRADVGGVLVTPRLLTCKELRGERATYTHSGKRNRRVFTQSREQREDSVAGHVVQRSCARSEN